MDVISLSSKGQIVIPERVREHMGLETGSKLVLIEKEDSLILKKEEAVEKQLENTERKEEIGWMILAENSLAKDWNNKKEDKTWSKYL